MRKRQPITANKAQQRAVQRTLSLTLSLAVLFFSLFGIQAAAQGQGEILGDSAYASSGSAYNSNSAYNGDSEATLNGAAESRDESYNLAELGITLHPGSDFMPDANGSALSRRHCRSLVYHTLQSLPKAHTKGLKHLTLYFSDSGRRGLGGGNTVILRCQNVTDEELVGVLVHEIGHIVDTGLFVSPKKSPKNKSTFYDGKNPVYMSDPSLGFYRLSWKSDIALRATASQYDFVSGYGMEDPFEDFAEAYAFYVLHGAEFRALISDNAVLAKKYTYLKNSVFDGAEFPVKEKKHGSNGSDDVRTQKSSLREPLVATDVDPLIRHYDVTVLPYRLESFFTL